MKNKRDIWMRIPVFILSGAIIHVWAFFICIFALVQLILKLLGEKQEAEFTHISSMFCNQVYIFFKYITFLSEEKPFPWGKLENKKK